MTDHLHVPFVLCPFPLVEVFVFGSKRPRNTNDKNKIRLAHLHKLTLCFSLSHAHLLTHTYNPTTHRHSKPQDHKTMLSFSSLASRPLARRLHLMAPSSALRPSQNHSRRSISTIHPLRLRPATMTMVSKMYDNNKLFAPATMTSTLQRRAFSTTPPPPPSSKGLLFFYPLTHTHNTYSFTCMKTHNFSQMKKRSLPRHRLLLP
jgi:hypothetical protein